MPRARAPRLAAECVAARAEPDKYACLKRDSMCCPARRPSTLPCGQKRELLSVRLSCLVQKKRFCNKEALPLSTAEIVWESPSVYLVSVEGFAGSLPEVALAVTAPGHCAPRQQWAMDRECPGPEHGLAGGLAGTLDAAPPGSPGNCGWIQSRSSGKSSANFGRSRPGFRRAAPQFGQRLPKLVHGGGA